MTGDSAETARRLLPLLDLASLNDGRDDDIAALCAKAVTPHGPVAAVCSWPDFTAEMKRCLESSGVAVARVYADKGYRGHDYSGPARVILSGRNRGLTPTMKRELKRRSAIEPMIGHAKTDGRLGRNYLLGQIGDGINALLAAAGHNMRLILNALTPAET